MCYCLGGKWEKPEDKIQSRKFRDPSGETRHNLSEFLCKVFSLFWVPPQGEPGMQSFRALQREVF